MACGIYYFCVRRLTDKQAALLQDLQEGIDEAFEYYGKMKDSSDELKHFNRIRNVNELKNVPEEEINSGGYVIDSIEASLWCLLNTNSYRECVLKAVNLGRDTDTTAAIAGGLAGLYYGYEEIPDEWKKDIIRRELIEEMCKVM